MRDINSHHGGNYLSFSDHIYPDHTRNLGCSLHWGFTLFPCWRLTDGGICTQRPPSAKAHCPSAAVFLVVASLCVQVPSLLTQPSPEGSSFNAEIKVQARCIALWRGFFSLYHLKAASNDAVRYLSLRYLIEENLHLSMCIS